MMLIGAILLFTAVLVIDLATDYRRWIKSRGVNHKRGAWIRILALIPSTVLFTIVNPYHNIWVFICAILMQFFTFWLVFDGVYNRLRGFDWWYTGGHNDPTEPDDGKLDRFQFWVGTTISKILKIVGSVLFIAVYIISFLK